MPQVITVAALKGGVGKTTTAAHLLMAFARHGQALGIDADGQGSLIGWAEMADDWPAPVVSMPTGKIARDLPTVAGDASWVVIDTPNDPTRSQPVVASALQVSDAVVVPLTPSPMDFLRLRPTLDLIAAAQAARPQLRAWGLLTRVRAGTRAGTEAIEALGDVGDLEVLHAVVPLRERIAQSVGEPIPDPFYVAVADELLAALSPAAV